MANTTIQIRRSTITATPASLANGELAYTANGDVLFIGSSAAVIPIAGKRFPGVLTSNQALVANATSGIDKVIVANLVPTNVWANGAAGTAGQVLTANSTGGVYWAPTGSGTAAGTDTQVQFNDGGSAFGADAGLTYNKTTDALTVAGSVTVASAVVSNATGIYATGTVNAASFTVGANFTANSTLVNAAAVNVVNQVNTATLYAATSANVGTAFTANSTLVNAIALNVVNTINVGSFGTTNGVNITNTTIVVGNTTANAIHNFNILQVANSTGTTNVNPTYITTPTVNATSNLNVGTFGTTNGVNITNTTIVVGNTIANATHNYNIFQVSNGTGTSNVNPGWITTGTVNATANLNVGTFGTTNGVNITNTSIVVGNTTANATHTVNLVQVANSTSTANLTPDSLALGTAVIANSTGVFTTGTVNAASHTVGTTFVANATQVVVGVIGTNAVASNTTAINIGNSSVNATVNSTVYTGTSNNSTFLSGVAAANFVQNTDSRTLSGNLTFTGSNLAIGPGSGNVNITTSNTYISGNVAIAGANITATGATLSVKDIIASGNLTVQGTLTTIDTVNIQVKDATLKLADQNTTTDLIDFGFYGVSGNATATYYSGLVRDHNLGTVANSVYTLFSTATEPGQTVDNTAPTYSLSTLRSYLSTTGLTTNSSTLAITATGSVNVAIVANTLSLSSALAVGSGGTGLSSVTNNAVLIGNTTGPLGMVSSSTEGHVLQISSTGLPTFNGLDGGTF